MHKHRIKEGFYEQADFFVIFFLLGLFGDKITKKITEAKKNKRIRKDN